MTGAAILGGLGEWVGNEPAITVLRALDLLMKRSISSAARIFISIVGITIAVERLANAQGQPSSSVADEEKLEQDFTDPLTTLPQLIVRDSYMSANYDPCTSLACTRDYETNQLIVRPLIPRIPPRSFLPFNQLIRPTLALVTVPSSRGGIRTEFGDLSVFDVAVLPWPDRKRTGLVIGVGPTFVFPTATSQSAGQGIWEAGPALGAIYTGFPPDSWPDSSPRNLSLSLTHHLIGHLKIHSSVNRCSRFIFGTKWYLRSAEATWTLAWRRHFPTMLPLSIAIGRTLVRPGLPPMSLFVSIG